MGIQDIIENGEKDIPINIPFQNEINDEDDFPVIYSDSSSDTASVTEINMDDFMLPLSEDDSSFVGIDDTADWVNDFQTSTDRSEHFNSNSSQNDIDVFVINLETRPSSRQLSERNDIEKLQNNLFKKIKNVSAKNKTNMGKRKARRFENARQLDLLTDDVCPGNIDIDDLMPFNCSFRFTQILEDIELTNKILNPSLNAGREEYITGKSNINKRKHSSSEKEKKMTASAAFNNLEPSERTFFKRRNLPMGMVHYLDSCVYSFFQSDPTGTYISEPLSSYERMMLHGIAHYYRLNSFSYNLERQDTRLTKITNNQDYFNPPCLCLSQYLEQEAQKDTKKFQHTEKRRHFRGHYSTRVR